MYVNYAHGREGGKRQQGDKLGVGGAASHCLYFVFNYMHALLFASLFRVIFLCLFACLNPEI